VTFYSYRVSIHAPREEGDRNIWAFLFGNP
jgi:hypothetical protein